MEDSDIDIAVHYFLVKPRAEIKKLLLLIRTLPQEYSGLKRIKARARRVGILFIFFGVHAANVTRFVGREADRTVLAA